MISTAPLRGFFDRTVPVTRGAAGVAAAVVVIVVVLLVVAQPNNNGPDNFLIDLDSLLSLLVVAVWDK
jgi:hypothetical protein